MADLVDAVAPNGTGRRRRREAAEAVAGGALVAYAADAELDGWKTIADATGTGIRLTNGRPGGPRRIEVHTGLGFDPTPYRKGLTARLGLDDDAWDPITIMIDGRPVRGEMVQSGREWAIVCDIADGDVTVIVRAVGVGTEGLRLHRMLDVQDYLEGSERLSTERRADPV